MSESEGSRYGHITDEALEQHRARLNKWYPITQPFNEYATRDTIRHYCRGIGDVNPLYLDPEYAAKSKHGGIIAPPGWLYSVFWGSWDLRRGFGLPGVHGFHSGDGWEWYRHVKEGERIRAERALTDIQEKSSQFAGRSILETRTIKFFDEAGELVARNFWPVIRTEREAAQKKGKYSHIQPAKYTEEDIKSIEADYDREEVRGANPRFWEDVQVGDELPAVVKGPLTVFDVIAWVMGVGSPHIRTGQYWLDYRRRTPLIAVTSPETGIPEAVERVHWDNYMAREAGLPNAYDYGSQRGAWATHLLTNWCGDDGFVKSVDVQFRGFNFLGDTTWVRGAVAGKRVEGNEHLVDIKIESTNQRGENIMPGTAVVALPSRGDGG